MVGEAAGRRGRDRIHPQARAERVDRLRMSGGARRLVNDAPIPRSRGRRFGGLMEGVALAWAYLVYERLRGQATGSTSTAFAHAHQIVGVERFVGIDVEHDVQQLFVQVGWFM